MKPADLQQVSGLVRRQPSAVGVNITQTLAEALKPWDLFARRDLLWIFNKAPVCVCVCSAVLSKYWPSGYFSVTLNGPLASPNYKVQKIHFPDSVTTGIAS